jgi:hypothetical protein
MFPLLYRSSFECRGDGRGGAPESEDLFMMRYRLGQRLRNQQSDEARRVLSLFENDEYLPMIRRLISTTSNDEARSQAIDYDRVSQLWMKKHIAYYLLFLSEKYPETVVVARGPGTWQPQNDSDEE